MMFGICSGSPGLGRPLAVLPLPIPVRLLTCWGACGFPSPADDYEEEAIDLGARLMPRPASTFLLAPPATP